MNHEIKGKVWTFGEPSSGLASSTQLTKWLNMPNLSTSSQIQPLNHRKQKKTCTSQIKARRITPITPRYLKFTQFWKIGTINDIFP